jgi:NADPH-dependent ferric siderophore reductase
MRMRTIATLFAAAFWLPVTARGPMDTVDPPPVNEEALARRLFHMVAAAPGERAIIVHDPTYYPGITRRLRESLHQARVHTYLIVEDSPTMIATYIDDPVASKRREDDVVSSLRPLFQSADIFYWLPTRGYGDDLRWERLVAESRVRSVHFHWLLRFPGERSAEEILTASRATERRSLDVDLAEHARVQRRLAAALQGQTVRITTPDGTDLTVQVPRDQWFHLGDGDASKARAATARSIRDRQMEMPVGMFLFVPEARRVAGLLAAPAIYQAGTQVRDARFELRAGRVSSLSAAEGEGWIRQRMRDVGPDGDKIATIHINTHPLNDHAGVTIDIGSNWENGGKNRAVGMRRMTIRLPDATVTTGAGTLMRDGRLGPS